MEQNPARFSEALSALYSPAPVDWAVSAGRTGYEAAVAAMEARAAAIAAGEARELVWLVEHPPLYPAGTSARAGDLLQPDRFPVIASGRGGQYTYHGPGQRVIYTMLDVKRRGGDVRAFVAALEAWIIDVLSDLEVAGETRRGRVGIWVTRRDGSGEDKIAAIGLRLKKWVSLHGASLNVAPDLTHYDGIVPCGVSEHGVTSLAALGVEVQMNEVDRILRARFARRFGPTQDAPNPES